MAPSVEARLDEVLARLVGSANGLEPSGRFRVEIVAGGRHLIPVARRDVSGELEPYTSPLDAPISIADAERTGIATLTLLTEALSGATGRSIGAGMMPVNLMVQRTVRVGAAHRPAREVLWEKLQQLDPALSWQMLCEVGEAARCAINLHAVRMD